MEGPRIEGRRVYLGPVTLADAPRLMTFYNQVRHFLGSDLREDMTLEGEEAFIRRVNKNESVYCFGIRLVETNEIIGTISVMKVNTYDGTCDTGTMLGEEYCGRGYGTEAKMLMLKWAFEQFGFRKVYSQVYGYNERSRAYALKCGYVQEATLKDRKLYEGQYWDEWILAVNREQWQAAWDAYNS